MSEQSGVDNIEHDFHQPNSGNENQMLCPIPRDLNSVDALKLNDYQQLGESGCQLAAAVRHRLRFETFLAELSSRFINVSADQVDAQIVWGLQRIVEILDLDRCGLGEVSVDGKQLIVTHSYQLPGIPPSEKILIDSRFPIYSKMVHQGAVIRLPDDLPLDATREREYCRQVGLKSNLTIPLMSMGKVVGGIGFSSFRKTRILLDDLIPRLRLVGDIFTNALTRKRSDQLLATKEQDLRQASERLQQLTSNLIEAQEEERRRIAREMHDDWAQRLAGLGIDLAKLKEHLQPDESALTELDGIHQQLANLSNNVHSLSRQLHPSILEDLGLIEAINSECRAFSEREKILVDFVASQRLTKVELNIGLCLYRVAQEALRNVAKHASVNKVLVELQQVEGELILRIKDHGIGFDQNCKRSSPGLGLSSMEERVALIGGTLLIKSDIDKGTVIEVRVDVESQEQE